MTYAHIRVITSFTTTTSASIRMIGLEIVVVVLLHILYIAFNINIIT